MKNLEVKTGRWDVNWGLWKTPAYYWKSRLSPAEEGLCAHPGKTWKCPNISLLADLEALYKQEVKAKAELSTVQVLKICLNMHTKLLDNGWRTYYFKAFEEALPNH